MRSLVIHPESGLVLDFAEEDFGGSEQAAVIDDWREWHLRRSARPGEFICHFHRAHRTPSVYLRSESNGQLIIACHWPESGLEDSHKISHGVSDEHRRQVDYLQRAGEAVGYDVRTEVSLPTKVRSDAVIYGPDVHMGVEVQRSGLAVARVKARTTQARRAGVEPVWFADSEKAPPWMWKVPSVRMNPDVPWTDLPGRRSVMVVSGVRTIEPQRCRSIRNSRCPDRPYGCNGWHPVLGTPFGTLVDDLAELVPAGRLVPMLYHTFTGRQFILIVPRNDKSRYEAMVGWSADVPLPKRERRPPQQTHRVDCTADAGGKAATLWCEAHGRFLTQNTPGTFYCVLCHQQEMNARGLGNYSLPQGPTS